jgi:hypothetical protein
MNDFVKIQEYLTQGLLCEETLGAINVKQWRKLRLQGQIDESVIALEPRVPAGSDAPHAGRSGCGALVEMPSYEVVHENISGPPGLITASVLVLEEPNLNFAPETGTQMSAEEVAKFIADSTHQWVIGGSGIFTAVRKTIEPADEYPGLVGYRTKLHMQAPRNLLTRCAPVTVTEVALNVTLASATEGAAIYYTLDESFPGPANEEAVLYAEAFDMEAGQVLLVAAYKSGCLRSNVGRLES